MTKLTLGTKPIELEVTLVAGADFTPSLSRDDDSDWPADADLTLRLYNRNGEICSWAAVLEGPDAFFSETDAEVDRVIAERPNKAKLWLVEGNHEALWALGTKVEVIK